MQEMVTKRINDDGMKKNEMKRNEMKSVVAVQKKNENEKLGTV